MDESSKLTPKEEFHASLYKDPSLMRRVLIRRLGYIVVSLGLMVVWMVTGDPAYAYFGYGILLYRAVYGIFLARRGIQTTKRVITKYEAKAKEVGQTQA